MSNWDGWQNPDDFPAEEKHEYYLIDGLKSRFEMHNIKDDGNCMFRAISYAYYGTEDKYENIKKLLSDYVKRNSDDKDIKIIVIGAMDDNEIKLAYPEQVIRYLEKLNTSRYWGNHQECKIIARIMNINIEVYDMNSNRTEYPSGTVTPIKTIYLYYCGKIPALIERKHFTHFNVLKLKPQPQSRPQPQPQPQSQPQPRPPQPQPRPPQPQPQPRPPPQSQSLLDDQIHQLLEQQKIIRAQLNASRPRYGENDYLRIIPNDISEAKKTELIELLNTYDFNDEPGKVREHIINDTKYKKFILDCILNRYYTYFPYSVNYTDEKINEKLWKEYKKNLEKTDTLTILFGDTSRELFLELLMFNREMNLQKFLKTVPEDIEEEKIKPLVLSSGFDDSLVNSRGFRDFVIRYLYKYINNSVNDIERLNHTEKEQLKEKARNIIFEDGKLKTSNINAIKNEVTKFIVKEYMNRFIDVTVINTSPTSFPSPEEKIQIKKHLIKQINEQKTNNITELFNYITIFIAIFYMHRYIDITVDGITVLDQKGKEELKERLKNKIETDVVKIQDIHNLGILRSKIDTFIINATQHLFEGGKKRTTKQDYFKLVSMYK
jgi:hypothetical protein